MKRILRGLVCAIFVLPLAVQAQWVTQTIDLEAGWNAVFLTVQPVPASCDSVFSDIPVERVVMWSRVKGGVEFISEPSEELARPADWLIWRPESDPQASLNGFYGLLAGKSYLIKMSEAATLNVKGRAVLVTPEWISNEMSLTGLPVGEGVTFGDILQYTDEVGIDYSDDGEIYEVQADGSEMQVFRPVTAPVVPGKAYWIKTGQELDFAGAVEVSLSSGGDYLDFGSANASRTLHIKNTTAEAREVTLTLAQGENPPGADESLLFPISQGLIPLSIEEMNYETRRNEYVDMPSSLTTNIAAHSTFNLTLMPRANEMTGADETAVWESLLNISDGETVQTLGMTSKQGIEEFTDPTGLWVGAVAVDAVSRAPSREGGTNVWDTVTPVSVSRPYTFRILLHVSSEGTVRLLQRVFPTIIPGVEGEDPVSKLFTDVGYAMQCQSDYPGAQITRISSANLPMMDPLALTGSFGESEMVTGTIVLPFDDPVNPFVHAFHPDHDNKEYRNGNPLPLGEGDESYTVSRVVKFSFENEDSLGGNPRWNVDESGGIFEEVVTGLNKTIYVKGAFRIEKVSDCGELSYLK